MSPRHANIRPNSALYPPNSPRLWMRSHCYKGVMLSPILSTTSVQVFPVGSATERACLIAMVTAPPSHPPTPTPGRTCLPRSEEQTTEVQQR